MRPLNSSMQMDSPDQADFMITLIPAVTTLAASDVPEPTSIVLLGSGILGMTAPFPSLQYVAHYTNSPSSITLLSSRFTKRLADIWGPKTHGLGSPVVLIALTSQTGTAAIALQLVFGDRRGIQILDKTQVNPFRPVVCLFFFATTLTATAQTSTLPTSQVFGYRDFTQQAKWDATFLAVPSAKLAGEHLKTLTAAPHRRLQRGLRNRRICRRKIQSRRPRNQHRSLQSLAQHPQRGEDHGHRARRQSTNDRAHSRARRPITAATPTRTTRASSPPSTAPHPPATSPLSVVYANYGTPEDFKKLAELHIDIKGKIVLVRYGHNFRGVKVYLAQLGGAAGVLIYSDPADDGYLSKARSTPTAPTAPPTGVQRGSVQFIFKYPGDATTPGIASDPDLPADKRFLRQAASQPTIPATPISWQDAEPILKALGGPAVPERLARRPSLRLPHGPGGVDSPPRAQAGLRLPHHLGRDRHHRRHHLSQRMGRRRQPSRRLGLWRRRSLAAAPPACSKPSTESANSSKPAGSPNAASSSASWDAEEEGLIGSTEWAEGHALISSTPSPTSTPTYPSPAPTSPPPPSPR